MPLGFKLFLARFRRWFNFVFAKKTYLKIPENSEYFIDAQRNIAFNYSRESVFTDAEDKIIKIVKKNNSDYELK